jgi:hypothetical protein
MGNRKRQITIEVRSGDLERLQAAYGVTDAGVLFERLVAFELQRLRFQPRPDDRTLEAVSPP